MQVRRLPAEDVSLVAMIDRSEHVDAEYCVIDGELQQIPAAITDVPAWDPTGSGPFTVAAKIAFCSSAVALGGILLGAFDGEDAAGLAIVHPAFEPRLAWLAFLHVSRPYRRRGAVGFYLRQGCRLAHPVHPDLFAEEPEDIHFACPLNSRASEPPAR